MSDSKKSPDFLRSPRFWVGVVIALIALAFILQNRQSVDTQLLMLTFSSPLWITLAGVFLAGFVTCWLIARRRQ